MGLKFLRCIPQHIKAENNLDKFKKNVKYFF